VLCCAIKFQIYPNDDQPIGPIADVYCPNAYCPNAYLQCKKIESLIQNEYAIKTNTQSRRIMNIYINALTVSHESYDEIKKKYSEFTETPMKLCVYGDWTKSELSKWNIVCQTFVLEQKQIQDATREAIHIAMTTDIMEDIMYDHYGYNCIGLFMIATSGLNFLNLCYKSNKYGKKLYIHIPSIIHKKKVNFDVNSMSTKYKTTQFDVCKENLKIVFQFMNEHHCPYSPLPFYNFKCIYRKIIQKNDSNDTMDIHNIVLSKELIKLYMFKGVEMIKLIH
jgi:hypothetical protein